jgi:tetratricopeptide (TPR) repeat protein
MVELMDRNYYRQQAARMALIQADYLLRGTSSLSAESMVSCAGQLIKDCVCHLDQFTLAVKVALGLHPVIERWSAWSDWASVLDALLNTDEQAYTTSDRIRLLHCRSDVAYELSEHDTAITMAVTSLHLAEAQQDQMLIAISMNKIGLAAYYRDDVDMAQSWWEQAYALGRAHLPSVQLGHICMNLGLVAEQHGQPEEAHRCFKQAFDYYQIQNEGLYIAKAQANIANIQRKQGQVENAAATLQEACNLFHAIDARYNYGLTKNNLGYAYLELGRFEQAFDAFGMAIHVFDSIGSLSGKALVLSNIAELHVTTEQWQKAATILEEARELAMACSKPLLIAAIDVDQGRMLAALGDYERARQVWKEALAVQEDKGALHIAQHTQDLINALPAHTAVE